LSINLEKAQWICHAYPDECGKGHLRTFIAKYLDVSVFEAEKMAFDGEIQEADLLPSIDEPFEIDIPLPEIDFPFNTQRVPKWIFNRGFTATTLQKWGCGLDSRSGSLVIPVRDEHSKMVGWLKRHPDGREPRYLYSLDFQKSKVLFGQYLLGSDYRECICLTEGSLDTMWLDQHGYASVALLGLFMSKRQERLLSKMPIREVILCLDNDQPGRDAAEHIQRRLRKYFVVSKIELPNGVKDVQEIRESEILVEVMNNRTIF
jgi:DNA primase